jgi:hypothetical protein
MDNISLFDYFAAHAPAEIPEWFKPSSTKAMPERPAPAPEIASAAEGWVKDPCFDFADAYKVREYSDLFPERHYPLAVAFELAMQVYWEECRRIAAENVELRFFEWRWAYAARMLAFKEQL